MAGSFCREYIPFGALEMQAKVLEVSGSHFVLSLLDVGSLHAVDVLRLWGLPGIPCAFFSPLYSEVTAFAFALSLL